MAVDAPGDTSLKALVKSLIAFTPYRVVRGRASNRFQEIDGSLRSMKDRGYEPLTVIDGGAHLGSFSISAKDLFPRARFHLIEPQPACHPSLRTLCAREGFTLHECALAESDGEVHLLKTEAPGTGAYVKPPGDDSVRVSAAALDSLFSSGIAREERALLKLDLQGYELHALRGGRALLKSVEAVLTEVSFFSQAYEPSVLELMTYLGEHGFQLYDVAALSARRRDNRLHQGDLIFVRQDSLLLRDSRWS